MKCLLKESKPQKLIRMLKRLFQTSLMVRLKHVKCHKHKWWQLRERTGKKSSWMGALKQTYLSYSQSKVKIRLRSEERWRLRLKNFLDCSSRRSLMINVNQSKLKCPRLRWLTVNTSNLFAVFLARKEIRWWSTLIKDSFTTIRKLSMRKISLRTLKLKLSNRKLVEDLKKLLLKERKTFSEGRGETGMRVIPACLNSFLNG